MIGDLTSNHSGDAHEWFRASHRNPGTPESEFYYWKDAEQEDYVSWLGVPSLPKFNWNSGELRRRFIQGPDSVVAKWLEPPYSLDGWRIDVANMTGRYLSDDLNAEVRQIVRQTMIDVNADTILLGESTNDATSDFQGDGWHGAMTYANFTRPVWGWLSTPGGHGSRQPTWFFGLPYGRIPQYTGRELLDAHLKFAAGLPWRVRLHTMNALDTHDTARFANRAMDGAVPVAVGMSMTLPGIPVVFMGDELGATGDDGEHSRTTMPWDTLDEHDARITLYSELIHLRTSHVALTEGGIRWLHADDDLLVYIREHADESVLVAATRAGFDLTLPRHAVAGEPISLFGDATASRDRGRPAVVRHRAVVQRVAAARDHPAAVRRARHDPRPRGIPAADDDRQDRDPRARARGCNHARGCLGVHRARAARPARRRAEGGAHPARGAGCGGVVVPAVAALAGC